jgi:hypothetical protein
MVEIPHRTNMHPQKGMYQGITEYHSKYVAKNHPKNVATSHP